MLSRFALALVVLLGMRAPVPASPLPASVDDPDGDGASNATEEKFGTDPNNPDTDGDGIRDLDEMTTYVLWGFCLPTRADTDGDGVPDGDEDWDGDGLTTLQELKLGTSFTWPDTDMDKLSDGQEVALGTNPFVADTDGNGVLDGDEDADGDALPLWRELALGSDPHAVDTDRDGVDDPQEVALCLNPTSADTDGDGVGDDVDDAFCVTRAPEGLADWKLFQRGPDGTAAVPIAFRYRLARAARVEIAVTDHATDQPLPGHAWGDHAVALAPDLHVTGGVGELVLVLPTGGNYDVALRVVDVATGTLAFPAVVESIAVGDVFLAAGQSNMSGISYYVPPDPADAPDPRVHLFGNDYRWKQASEPMDDAHGAVDRVSNFDLLVRVSPMLRFAKDVAAGAGVPVGLVPAPAGGTTLIPDPKPYPYATSWARRSDQPDDRGSLYGSAIFRVQAQHYEHPIRGVIWYQGENDALTFPTSPAPYREALAALVASLRADLGNPDLYFASCQLSTTPDARLEMTESWLTVSEAQRQYAESDARSTLVGLVDLPHEDVHLGAAGSREAGRRLAAAVLRGAYGVPAVVGPRLTAIRRRRGGKRIELKFDKRLTGGDAASFRVRRGPTPYAITGFRVRGRRVGLSFDAVPRDATIGYGYGSTVDHGWLRARDASGSPLTFRDVPVVRQ